MKRITVFFGAKSFTYFSHIVPMIGDNYCKVPEFSDGDEHYIVTQRLPSREHAELITVIVEAK